MKGTRTLAWHGHRLAYTEAGSGPPLLLLHGWAASSRFWEAAVRHLAPAFRCIALDWLGYGDSDRPGKPVGFDGHAEAVGTVLREFAIEGATVVGHSMGGTLAARAAAPPTGSTGARAVSSGRGCATCSGRSSPCAPVPAGSPPTPPWPCPFPSSSSPAPWRRTARCSWTTRSPSVKSTSPRCSRASASRPC
ncbi:MAG: hypothetical protein COS73_10620 [Nitrospirae bacterium CG06_land_8_20_14_3_00_70_43]|nr:MAG: hypothetical protein COS73_10620 [Nitrospirae bacterium CG06_land_8_20_14_3_00_70_43]